MRMLRAFAAAVLLGAILSCDHGRAPTTPPDQTHTVEGTVVALPRQGAEVREISIAHEAIPDFVNRQGERTGMPAMTMQFEVADGVSLAGIAEGDRVRFTFELRWRSRPMLYVTDLHAL